MYVDKLRPYADAIRDVANKCERDFPHWIQGGDCGWTETYVDSCDCFCGECVEKITEQLRAEAPQYADEINWSGGWSSIEEDGPEWCSGNDGELGCGKFLEVSYTDYAIESELEGFEGWVTSPDFVFDSSDPQTCAELMDLIEACDYPKHEQLPRLLALLAKCLPDVQVEDDRESGT